jgi:hypothetical protein
MATRSRIIYDARAMAGGPPDAPLPEGVPESLCYSLVVDIEEMMLRDLTLSSTKRRVTSQEIPLTTNQAQFDLGGAPGSTPVYAQLQLDSSDTFKMDVEIVNLDQLDGYRRDRRLAMALNNDPAQVSLTWKPDNTQTLFVWYERLPEEDPRKGDEPAIDKAYTAYLKWQLAAMIREQWNKPIGAVMTAMIGKSEAQWSKFTRSSFESGVVRKRPWRPGRYRRQTVSPGGFRISETDGF